MGCIKNTHNLLHLSFYPCYMKGLRLKIRLKAERAQFLLLGNIRAPSYFLSMQEDKDIK